MKIERQNFYLFITLLVLVIILLGIIIFILVENNKTEKERTHESLTTFFEQTDYIEKGVSTYFNNNELYIK